MVSQWMQFCPMVILCLSERSSKTACTKSLLWFRVDLALFYHSNASPDGRQVQNCDTVVAASTSGAFYILTDGWCISFSCVLQTEGGLSITTPASYFSASKSLFCRDPIGHDHFHFHCRWSTAFPVPHLLWLSFSNTLVWYVCFHFILPHLPQSTDTAGVWNSHWHWHSDSVVHHVSAQKNMHVTGKEVTQTDDWNWGSENPSAYNSLECFWRKMKNCWALRKTVSKPSWGLEPEWDFSH